MHCSKSMEKSEVIQIKLYFHSTGVFSLRWSVDTKFYIFTSENIKYTLNFINIFLYFTTLYIIKVSTAQGKYEDGSGSSAPTNIFY